jgi:transcriptional regulator with XRE-family HTH domain
MSLSENIYRFRTEQNMSQLDLADALEVSRQSVSKWETGTAVPELDKLVKMCDLFDVSLDVLVGRDVTKPDSPVPESPVPTQQGIFSGDLVSILILLFGVLIPVVILATAELHDSVFLIVLGIFILPPTATICAAYSSPTNNVLFRAFVVYDIIFGIIACIMGNILAPIIGIFYVFAIGFWNDKREAQ